MDPTYCIVRYFADSRHPEHRTIIEKGLSLEEAQEHCNSPDTHEEGVWFDGYTEE